LNQDDPRGLVIFPADRLTRPAAQRAIRGEWWLVVAAIALAAVMIAIAYAIR
jgi:hypothetical protein